MLKNKADRRALAFVAVYFVLVFYQWFFPLQNLVLQIFCLGLTAIVSWLAAVITHNALHCPLFKRRLWNRVFQAVLTVTYGFPVSEYTPGHNLSHHQYTQTRKDVMRTSKVRFKSGFLNFFCFFPMVAFGITKTNYEYIRRMRYKNRIWYQQLLIEMTLCWGSKLVLFMIDWRKCLWIIVIPHLFAVWAITTINYLWHDGCDAESPYNHSRNFVGTTFNWFFFNNGYHGIHHMYPALHWSLLPERHAKELHPFIHPNLEQRSFIAYLGQVLFGERRTFDGSPIRLLDEGADEDWIRSSSSPEYTFG